MHHREEQSSPASSFWPSYWGYRGAVHEYEYSEYEEYEEDENKENRVGRLVTKSGGRGRSTRLSELEDSDALRLQSKASNVSTSSLLLLTLSTALALARL